MNEDFDTPKPGYPPGWLDGLLAAAWAPPNLPLFGDGVVTSGWDRFPLAPAASTRSFDPASAVAGSASAANIPPNGGALAASDLPLDGPRAASLSWDSFPLAQPASTRSPDPASGAASGSASAADIWSNGGALAAPDVPLDSPRAAPISWDSFPLAQTQTKASSPLAPANPTAGAPALPPGVTLDQPSVAADVFKAVPVKLAQGTLGLVGSAGDTRQYGNEIIDTAGDYLGAPDWLKTGLKVANDIGSLIGNPGSIMTSADLQNKAEQVTGPFYEPKTLPGKVLGTIASFVPAAIGGEGAILPRIIKQAGVPGVASEAAGQLAQLAQGTAAEKFARPAAAIAASVAAHKVGAQFPINEAPRDLSRRLISGYPHLVRVDAKRLRDAVERDTGAPLNLRQVKMDAVRRAGGDTEYPYVQVNDRGQPRIDDGTHNVAAAAERGQAIDVAATTPQQAQALRQFSPDRAALLLKALLAANAAMLPFRMPVAQPRQ